jgi:hypothetical protein
MQNNPNHGNTSMQKHLLNEHLDNFGKYKVKLEFGEGGVGGGIWRKIRNDRRYNHQQSHNILGLVRFLEKMKLHSWNSLKT